MPETDTQIVGNALWRLIKWAANGIVSVINLVPYGKFVAFGLILVIILACVFSQYCGKSHPEKDLKKAQGDDIQKQGEIGQKGAEVNSKASEVEVKAKDAQESHKRSESARHEVNKARETNTNGTKYEDANHDRCIAYPNDSGCR